MNNFQVGKLYFAVHRLIDSVWTMQFRMEQNGITIIAYDRTIEFGYENEKSLPRVVLHEKSNRTVTGISLYKAGNPFEVIEKDLDGTFEVLNPQFIFSYGNEVSNGD